MRYCGNTERGFFVLADDFRYEAAKEEYGTLTGYDIYKDGKCVQENINVRQSWTDPSYKDGDAIYAVVPVYRKNGELVRGLMSNTVNVNAAGIDVNPSADWRVSGQNGSVILEGLSGFKVSVCGIDGIVLRSFNVPTDHLRIEMPAGMYVVVTPKGSVKVSVR